MAINNLEKYTSIIKDLDLVLSKLPAEPIEVYKSFEHMVLKQEVILRQEDAIAKKRLLPPTTPMANFFAKKTVSEPTVNQYQEEQKIEVAPREDQHYDENELLYGEQSDYNQDEHISDQEDDLEQQLTPAKDTAIISQARVILGTMRTKLYNEHMLLEAKIKNKEQPKPTECAYLFQIPTSSESSFASDLEALNNLIIESLNNIPLNRSKEDTAPYIENCLKLIAILAQNGKRFLLPKTLEALAKEQHLPTTLAKSAQALKNNRQIVAPPKPPVVLTSFATHRESSRGSRASAATTIKCKNPLRSCVIS